MMTFFCVWGGNRLGACCFIVRLRAVWWMSVRVSGRPALPHSSRGFVASHRLSYAVSLA
jgi:hypothetical protein